MCLARRISEPGSQAGRSKLLCRCCMRETGQHGYRQMFCGRDRIVTELLSQRTCIERGDSYHMTLDEFSIDRGSIESDDEEEC